MLAWLQDPYGTHPPKIAVIDSWTKALPSVQHIICTIMHSNEKEGTLYINAQLT